MRLPSVLRRMAEDRLLEALDDSPVVLLHGPRQCGKTTLARMVGEPRGYGYVCFDDEVTVTWARQDPVGFVADLPPRCILDEVQRVPELFSTLKAVTDRERRAGRFLLTGSGNVLLLPRLSDSLAGRMALIRLHPFSQSEVAGRASTFLDSLFGGVFPSRFPGRMGRELAERIVAGGFPAALSRTQPRRRRAWYTDFVETLVQRDVRDVGRIHSLHVLPRLLTAAAGATARLMNISDLAGPFQVSRPTIREYVIVLERLFLLDSIPSWHSNRLSRLVKTPKLHMGDTGLACALLGLDADGLWRARPLYGQMLETFVYQELRRLASGFGGDLRFHHYRDKEGAEVDVVLELGACDLVGVEVKAAATVTAADFRGLKRLASAVGPGFRAGVVLYDGEVSMRFGDRLQAVPIRALWGTESSTSDS